MFLICILVLLFVSINRFKLMNRILRNFVYNKDRCSIDVCISILRKLFFESYAILLCYRKNWLI